MNVEASGLPERPLGMADHSLGLGARLGQQAGGHVLLGEIDRLLEHALDLFVREPVGRLHVDRALAAYEAADVADPTSNALLWAARLALDSGRPVYARRAYQTLCTRDSRKSACDALEREFANP